MRTWWERASGVNLLGWPVVAGYALIGIVPIIATIPAGDVPAADRLSWLGVAFIAQLGLSVVALIGGRLVGDRESMPARMARVGVVALAGAVRGIIVQVAADSFGLVDPTNTVSRVLNSTLTVVLWMGVLAILVDAQIEFRRSYRRAFARDIAIAARVSEDDTWEQVDDVVRRWSSPVQQHIEGIRGGLRAGEPPDQAVTQAADAIRELVSTRLRPLSHRLWFTEAGQPPRVRVGPVALEAISRGPILTPIVLGLLVAGLFIGSVVRNGVSVAAVAGGSFCLLAMIYLGFSRLSIAQRVPRVWNLVTVPVFAIICGVVPSTLPEYLLGVPADLPTILTITIAIIVFALIVAMARVTSADRRDLLDAMHDPQVMQAAVRRVREQEAATYLHNHMKSALTASALRMREGVRSDDPQAVRDAADSAAQVLARPIPDAIMLGRQSPAERLREVTQSWQGIAEVEVDLPEGLTDATTLLLADVLAEAIANAVRSGGATWICVVGRQVDHALEIVIRDNGQAVSAGDRRGMGTAWLDSMVPGMWQRTHAEEGTTLRLIVPR